MKKTELSAFIKMAIGEIMATNPETILETDSFHSLGLDSYSCIVVLDKIEAHYKLELNPVLFWDYPTVGAFTDYLFDHYCNAN